MTNPESTAIDPVAAMGTDHTEAPAHPLHKVLSFVRRSGRLDDRLQRAWDNYAGTYLLDIAAGNLLDVREGVTLDRAFVESAWGNDNPLIVEIGTGQGENVVAAAAAHPMLPVGSSATIIVGLFTSARAKPTRCCSPASRG